MQDRSLDAMAKKYKEEMMRLYARQPESEPSAPIETEKPRNTTGGLSASISSEQPQTEKNDMERLMHPPMPKIPQLSQNVTKNSVQSAKADSGSTENTQKSKFPSPDELMAGEMLQSTTQSDADSMAQSESAPRFDSAKHGHEQGNYDFTDDQNVFPDGEGYLKLEVSGGGQPLDCALVAVFRVTDGGDVLTATFFTDAKGETEVITLPVLGLDEKYTVTVAKEGFFTVYGLEIPIFDSIKSIQPIELKQE